MKKLLVVTTLLHMSAITLSAPSEVTHKNSNTTYDQRQVGKYNIHFNIKDVSIIALSSEDIIDHIGDSDSYADYYDYEDSEYTVNPATADLSVRPTTAKPNQNHPLLPSIAGLNLSSITTSTDLPASIPQTVVVIHEKPSTTHENETVTQSNKDTESSSDQIPVEVIYEPLLKPKIRPSQSMKRKLTNRQVSEKNGDDDDEVRIRPRRAQIRERIRSRRAHNKLARSNGNSNRCGRGETSDCRVRRSGMSGFLDFLTKFLPQRDSE